MIVILICVSVSVRVGPRDHVPIMVKVRFQL